MKSHQYFAFGLRIQSNLPFPELPLLLDPNSAADVLIQVHPVEASPQPLRPHKPSVFVSVLDDIGRFTIQGGRELHVHPFPQVSEAELRLAILGPALSVVLWQRGWLVLHASSVAVGDGAIAFMGQSGAGKSTLAAAFHAQGYKVLTDDVMAVDLCGEQPLVLPSYPQLKLWPNAAAIMGYQDAITPLFPQAVKCSYQFDQQFQATPLPLRRLYVLAKATDHRICALAEQQAFAALTRHTRSIKVMNDQQTVRQHLLLVSRLMQRTSIRVFARKPNLNELSRLVELVEEDMANPTLHSVL